MLHCSLSCQFGTNYKVSPFRQITSFFGAVKIRQPRLNWLVMMKEPRTVWEWGKRTTRWGLHARGQKCRAAKGRWAGRELNVSCWKKAALFSKDGFLEGKGEHWGVWGGVPGAALAQGLLCGGRAPLLPSGCVLWCHGPALGGSWKSPRSNGVLPPLFWLEYKSREQCKRLYLTWLAVPLPWNRKVLIFLLESNLESHHCLCR